VRLRARRRAVQVRHGCAQARRRAGRERGAQQLQVVLLGGAAAAHLRVTRRVQA